MDFDGIITAIGSLGFPICMCIAMFWHNNKQTEIHKEEISKMTDALNNNTIALTKLESKIGDGEYERN